MNHPKRITIAIAEDQDFIRELCIKALESSGSFHVTVIATDGLDLIQKLILTPVDVILLDINMPIMNGDEVMDYLLKTEKKSKIILYSSNNSKAVIDSFLKRGAHAYITKDTEINKIVDLILEEYNRKD